MSSGVAARSVATSSRPSPLGYAAYAVVINADRMAAGLQSWCAERSSAASPLTCGHDMDVPDMMLKLVRRSSPAIPDGPTDPDHAARMFTPGAIRSGLRMPGVTVFGPLDEKAATTGDGWIPTFVPANTMLAVGFGSDDA
uniref:Uncharacterized protein n=1 Tax=Triticum urartu TaxID=4572 RepID=A0A8R7UP02_TRIUA